MKKLENWFVYALIGTIGFSFMTLLIRYITTKELSPALTMTYLFTIAAVVLWLYSGATEKITMPSKWILISLIAASVLSAGGNILMTTSIKIAPNPGYTQAVIATNIILVTALSIVLFSLKVQPIAIIGVILIFAGVIVLSLV